MRRGSRDESEAHLIALCIQSGGVLDDNSLRALLSRAAWSSRLTLGPQSRVDRGDMITNSALHRLGAMRIHQRDLAALADQMANRICLQHHTYIHNRHWTEKLAAAAVALPLCLEAMD